MSLTVACVLKSGGVYTPEHVQALWDGVERNLSLEHRFVCLSDVDVPCERIPLRNNWPGWWSKIELFRPRLLGGDEGPIVYFDLDTIIVGPLDDIVLGHRFTVLRNFWAEVYGELDRIGSGLMAWNTNLEAIYDLFSMNSDRFIWKYQSKAHWGDQAFIKEHTPVAMARWQDKHPGRVVSFKKHVLPNRRIPEGASVCCFHGAPRPWDLKSHEREWFERAREVA